MACPWVEMWGEMGRPQTRNAHLSIARLYWPVHISEKVMHLRPSIVSSLLCLTFLTTPTPFVAISSLICRFSAVCGVFVVQGMPGCCCCFAVRPGGYAPLPGSSWCVSRRLNSSSPVACKDVQAQHRRNVPPPPSFWCILYVSSSLNQLNWPKTPAFSCLLPRDFNTGTYRATR